MCLSWLTGGGSNQGAFQPLPQAPSQPPPQAGPAAAGSPLLQDTGGAVRQDPMTPQIGNLFMRGRGRFGEQAGRDGDPGISGNTDINPGGQRGGVY